jgi:hypothetical protein
MDKRIKELAVQAGLENTLGCFWQSGDYDLERFADLVRQDYLRELKALEPVGWFDWDSTQELWVQVYPNTHGKQLYALEVTK